MSNNFFLEHKQFPFSSVHILQHQCNHSCQGSFTSFYVYFSFNFFPCFHLVDFFFFLRGLNLFSYFVGKFIAITDLSV